MQEKIEFNGVSYLSLKCAAEEIDLSRDYMARLCKKGAVDARRLDSGWYVDPASIRSYLRAQEHASEFRRRKLAEERAREYRKKTTQNIAKSESIVSAISTAPAINYASDAHGRMRSAIERQSSAAFSVISESGRMPGMLHAAADIPVRALVHMPAHVISPTMDLIHRATALIGACILVLGTYSLFEPSLVETAYESMHGSMVVVLNAGRNIPETAQSVAHVAAAQMSEFARSPSHTVAHAQAGVAKTYGSLIAIALEALPRGGANVAASGAAIETPSPVIAIAPVEAPLVSQLAAAAGASDAVSASIVESTQPIAIAVPFTGAVVSYGDLIAYDPKERAYTLTSGSNDANIYGVAIQDPALVYKPDSGSDISVARSGAALMNVTLENGPIAQGDRLTSSSIAGKGRKAKEGEHVIAVATESFAGEGVTLQSPDGRSLPSGTISVNVSIGVGASSRPGEAACTSVLCRIFGSIDVQIIRALVRYLLSGIIAALSLTLAFKSFMSDANYGVISIGRNPRAKSSIQSLVFFNAILALAIASAGLFAAMVVLFAG